MILKFKPILKEVLWGGDKIANFKHIDIESHSVGESWEISGIEGHETAVAEGEYKGTPLNTLVGEMKEQLVGSDNYKKFGDEFPLLIKFIDAHHDLSIQVHPNDETARRQGYERGKTEMWYIIDSDSGKLYSGLKQTITPEEYAQRVADGSICDVLAQYEVKADDVFFLPAGRIHAICAGCFLAEIQQTSDVTWRIYDYKRKDKDGHERPLHTREAAQAIDYRVETDYRTEYRGRRNEGVNLVNCEYFNTAVYDLTEDMVLDYSDLDSFVILICVAGQGIVADSQGHESTLQQGECLLVSATEKCLHISGEVKFLETYC